MFVRGASIVTCVRVCIGTCRSVCFPPLREDHFSRHAETTTCAGSASSYLQAVFNPALETVLKADSEGSHHRHTGLPVAIIQINLRYPCRASSSGSRPKLIVAMRD
ncbi:hypothetical protein H4582DRAFT_1953156 [Lactarius indigo]|nr:hypothetical protein H4582DRAFT_1953156 [Lactarius indigo]